MEALFVMAAPRVIVMPAGRLAVVALLALAGSHTDGAHPYSTGKDQCLVHNGSLSNHNNLRRELIRDGMKFSDGTPATSEPCRSGTQIIPFGTAYEHAKTASRITGVRPATPGRAEPHSLGPRRPDRPGCPPGRSSSDGQAPRRRR